MRTLLQRALLVCVGLLFAIALLEGTLRLAALVLPSRLVRSAGDVGPPVPGELRILCVGDSHTYGVGVTPDQAYPAQLERILRARGVRARVVNAGIPGQGSGQLRELLADSVKRYEPHLVFVWVGANNQWRILREADAAAARGWLGELRLARLLRLMLGRFEGVSGDFRRELDRAQAGEATPTATPDREPRTPEAAADATAEDLGPIVETIRRANAVPILLTYPVTLRAMLVRIDEAIVATGARLGVRVIDLRPVADRHRKLGARLLLPDLHPTGPFYRALSWEMARTLLRNDLVPPSALDPAR